jgi:RNA polymerase sigma-54 factor
MRLEFTPKPEHTLRVSARLITSSTVLHLSSDEFERAINQEHMENPAFDVKEQRICLFCGNQLYGQVCPVCGHYAPVWQLSCQPADFQGGHFSELSELSGLSGLSEGTQHGFSFKDTDIDNYGFAQVDSADDFDPLAGIPQGETLAENLLQQLEALIPPEDAPIAEQLVGNLNERGYLEIGTDEVATLLGVEIARVEYVLHQLQTLEPLGIGARNLRECLLIQLAALSEQSTPHPLAYTLIDHYLEALGRSQYHEIARQLKVPERDVREAARYIRSILHPYPAHIHHSDLPYAPFSSEATGVTYIRPDVIIRKGESGYEVEIVEERRYQFQVKARYDEYIPCDMSASHANEIRRYLHHHIDRAKFFVDCIQRRWRTLKNVATLVIEYQQEFLEKGVRALKPLTRAKIAAELGLDEGTVSRATANKYVLLPNGRLMPMADFFDNTLGVKDVLRELIQSEDPRHRLSDEELARLLTTRGIATARRTVTKYREEMHIGSSRER